MLLCGADVADNIDKAMIHAIQLIPVSLNTIPLKKIVRDSIVPLKK